MFQKYAVPCSGEGFFFVKFPLRVSSITKYTFFLIFRRLKQAWSPKTLNKLMLHLVNWDIDRRINTFSKIMIVFSLDFWL